MATQDRSFPFRWVLPLVQFGICLALLWPARDFLLFGVIESVHSYSAETSKSTATSGSKEVYDIVITPDWEMQADAEAKLWERRKTVPMALNFPVLIAQLPYIVATPARREWVPKGMFPDVWRALSWPFAGMFFWRFLGRDAEALSAARRMVASPRISRVETTFAIILLAFGLISLIGILTSTPDDRRDIGFMQLVAGGLLWGFLATTTIAAKLLQRRIVKRGAALQSTT